MLIAVISDTHMPHRAQDLPPAAWERITASDVVVHAGDITEQPLLDALAATCELIAVRGNNDHHLPHLAERMEVTLDGVAVGIIHDAGAAAGRRQRMRRIFPGTRVVVYGHSHIPFLEDDGNLLLLNPGSPTDRRRMPMFTMATLSLRGGEVESARIVDLGITR